MDEKAGDSMATIKDVAREAGLTVGTVSRVLNNRGYISEATRNRVHQVMKELNYQPNEVARSLSKSKTNTIGVIVPHIVHPYFAKLISNLEKAASDRGFKILLCNSREERERELEYLEMLKSNRVAGLVLCSATVKTESLESLDIPVITIERNVGTGTASVECDNYQGGVLAARHLIACGCKYMINFSGVDKTEMPADSREVGFLDMCRQYGVEGVACKSQENQYYAMEYHEYIEKIITENPKTDGIFASSDLIAAQVLQVCAKLGLRVPEQVKVVGFDDVNIASLTTPPITTVHQPVKEMAELSVDLIMRSNKGEMIPTRTVLPVTLVKRGTTA